MVDAELAAFDATGDLRPSYAVAELRLAWYYGKNIAAASPWRTAADATTGCEADGPNRNMGAESTLALPCGGLCDSAATSRGRCGRCVKPRQKPR